MFYALKFGFKATRSLSKILRSDFKVENMKCSLKILLGATLKSDHKVILYRLGIISLEARL